MEQKQKKQGMKVSDLVYIAVGTVLITVCSWISIPMTVPFTLQTFAVFFVIGLLGGKRGLLSVIVYILLGAVGVPVFSGFTGGIAKLTGMTGGYIVGFIFIALIAWLFEKFHGNPTVLQIIALVCGLVVCYAFGTAWFMVVYAGQSGPIGLGTALGMCVFPFIIPDLVKLALAVFASGRVKKILHL